MQKCGPLSAQFYTVGEKPVSFRVQKQQDLPDSGKGCKEDSSTTVGKSVEGSKEDWIQRYLSVSFPLKRMMVSSPYGWRSDPFTGERRMHSGIDFQARGSEVYAMMSGVVSKVGEDKRSGIYMTIAHGDYTVSYCHLSKVFVRKGSLVMPGEPVACTGNTGRSTGEHLHFGVRYKGKAVNPNILLEYVRTIQTASISELSAR